MNSNIPAKFFHYKDIKIELHPEVYEPSEDTFQLIEAINVEKGDKVLEIGTGCGLVSLYCAQKCSIIVCTDINPYAVDLAKRNFIRNRNVLKGSFDIRQGDLFSVIKENEQFDIVIFNPPYLPTKKHERIGGSGWFDLATDGGINGLSKTKRFIEGLPKILTKKGRAYFVFSSLSNRKRLNEYLTRVKLKYEILSSRRFDEELIEIYCAYF